MVDYISWVQSEKLTVIRDSTGSIEGTVEVKVINNNVEKALKVAKKKLAADGLFRELKRRRFYEKPSVKKKAKEREAARRRQKWLSKHRLF